MTVYHPTKADFLKWRRLVKHARAMVRNPNGPAGDLRAAAKSAGTAVAPTLDVLTRFGSPLVRLGLAFPAMDDATRAANIGTLGWLAEGLAPLVGMPEPAQPREQRVAAPAPAPAPTAGVRLGLHLPLGTMIDDPRPERAPRADIDG